MAKNIIYRFRVTVLTCILALAIIELAVMGYLYRKFLPTLILFAVYFFALIALRLADFYREKKKYMFLMHVGLTFGVFLASLVIRISAKEAFSGLLLMNCAYLAWVYAAEEGVKRQMSPSATLLIGDLQHLNQWVGAHPDMYWVAAEMLDEDLQQIRKQIQTFRIPLILTDETPSSVLLHLVKEEGVMLHVVSDENISGLDKISKYNGLYVYIPES